MADEAALSWEERMAERAAGRLAAERELKEAEDPHRDHHFHLQGTAVYCSCGEWRGVTCVAFPDEFFDDPEAYIASLSCDRCGEVGVVRLR
jgi:hypothetical protein